jgi:hypothetical protein
MHKIDFVNLILLVIMAFFTGTLYETVIQKYKAQKKIGLALTLFSIVFLFLVVLLYGISQSL